MTTVTIWLPESVPLENLEMPERVPFMLFS